MDLTAAITPKSDQVNSDDLLSGPITVTIAAVRPGTQEQPVNIDLVERPGRAYRPSKSMLRVMVLGWGTPNADEFVGRRITLYRNPDITFGRDKVGGIEISHMSGLKKRMSIPITATRGKKRVHTVEPLPDAAPTSYTMPKFADADEAREHWRRRKTEGATPQELDEITTVAKALAANQPQQVDPTPEDAFDTTTDVVEEDTPEEPW